MDPLKVIAEPRRRQILAMVWDREMAAGEIADNFDVTFGAVSQHLAVLRNAGFVNVRPDGNRRLYQTDQAGLGPLRELITTMWSGTLDQLVDAVEADMEPTDAD